MPFPFLLLAIQLLIGIGTTILGYLIMPKAAQSKPEAATDMDAPTAESRPIPVLFGELDIAPNIIWFGDKTTTTRKVKA